VARRGPPTICAIGDLILDVVVLPDGPLAVDADTSATIRLTPGGQAANVAAWAAALGATSRLICARGTDASSALAAAELKRRGVAIAGPVIDGPGGVVASLGDAAGGRTMASDRGVAAQLAPDAIDPAWLHGCDALHISGYCLLRDPIASAAARAARHVPRVTVDLASAPHIERFGAARFAARLVDLGPSLIFANEAERAVLPDLEARWVVKLGARGVRFPEGEYPAPPANVVDTTGAGDALAAGYLVGGPDLALRTAARCVAQIGAMPPVGGAAYAGAADSP